MRQARAFTLVEILIVVVLLGVLAGIVIPAVSHSATLTRETGLASDVGLLRRFVLIYKSQHLEVSPGYPNGDTTATPTGAGIRGPGHLVQQCRRPNGGPWHAGL